MIGLDIVWHCVETLLLLLHRVRGDVRVANLLLTFLDHMHLGIGVGRQSTWVPRLLDLNLGLSLLHVHLVHLHGAGHHRVHATHVVVDVPHTTHRTHGTHSVHPIHATH